jgi:hypothetical protein
MLSPVTVAERSKVCTAFARWEAGIVGSNPKPDMDVLVCVYVYSVCVVLCLGSGLTTSWSLVQGVLPSVKWSWNLKAEARAQVGCRASEKKNTHRHINADERILRLIIIQAILSYSCVFQKDIFDSWITTKTQRKNSRWLVPKTVINTEKVYLA